MEEINVADHEKLRVEFIGFNAAVVSLNFIIGKLVSLDGSIDSMLIDF